MRLEQEGQIRVENSLIGDNMLEWLFSWARQVKNRVFPVRTVQNAFDIKNTAVSEQMEAALSLWAQIYADKAPWLDELCVRSAGIAAQIANKWAVLATIEMSAEVHGNNARAVYLNEQFQALADRLPIELQYAFATGGMVFKPYPAGAKILVDCVPQGNFVPVEVGGDGVLTAAVFFDMKSAGDKNYVRIEYHQLANGKYTIQNKAYEGTTSGLGREAGLSVVPEWDTLQPIAVVEGVDRPLYGYLRVPRANKADPSSKLGVSCFADAVEFIKKADIQWDRIDWEYDSAERSLYVDRTVFNNDAPNPKPRLLKTLDLGTGNESALHEFSPEPRDAAFINGLNEIKREIEFHCGLSYGIISDPEEKAMTATEILSSKQNMYATNYTNQKAMRAALDDLVYAMDAYASMYSLAPPGSYEFSIDFKDSILSDEDAQIADMRNDVAAGLVRPELYIMRKYSVTEEQAKEMMPAAEQMNEAAIP